MKEIWAALVTVAVGMAAAVNCFQGVDIVDLRHRVSRLELATEHSPIVGGVNAELHDVLIEQPASAAAEEAEITFAFCPSCGEMNVLGPVYREYGGTQIIFDCGYSTAMPYGELIVMNPCQRKMKPEVRP